MTKIIFNKEQDEIAIIAPSSGCPDAKEKLQEGIKLLKERGFICKYDKNILSGNEDLSYFASSKQQRQHELKQALLDPKVKIIWSFRGGYGASEIVLDFTNFSKDNLLPKILIGFSDITVLLLLFWQKFKMPAIHGSVLTSIIGGQPKMLDPLISVLSGQEMKFDLKPLNEAAKNTAINGRIVGGNLTIICHVIGSSLSLDSKNRIIFLEDVNEKGYQIHRYLMQMKNAALFTSAKAVIFGDFSNSDEHLLASLGNFCNEYLNIPAFRTNGIGHLPENYPVVIGGKAQIKNNNLTVNSPFGLI